MAMSAKDHPNNAPGVPMVFPVWVENFQVKYVNPVIKPFVALPAGHSDHQASRPQVG